MRIEIAGIIATGKTTLANLISSEDCIFEDFKSNTFLSAFYENPSKYAFETEFSFIFQHYHQIKKSDFETKICDFSLIQDLAYGKMGLKGKRLDLFTETYIEIINEINYPDILVFLTCDFEILVERIRKRGRENEKGVNTIFLSTLNQLLTKEIETIDQSKTKIIRVDTGKHDLLSDITATENLIKEIRSYF